MLAPAKSLESGPLARHYPFGASTGYMTEHRGDWNELVAEAQLISWFAIELAALSETELPGLQSYLAEARDLPFRYISVHAPSKAMELPEAQLVERLLALPRWIDAIVVHPDVIEDPESYAALGRRLVLENMDARKNNGRTATELGVFFDALPDAGLCFDIAHVWDVDKTMREGEAILDSFASRLRHVHLSSLDESSHHVPLRGADAQIFAPLLARCRDVPWILEAPPPNE
jgi:hypothetical protein